MEVFKKCAWITQLIRKMRSKTNEMNWGYYRVDATLSAYLICCRLIVWLNFWWYIKFTWVTEKRTIRLSHLDGNNTDTVSSIRVITKNETQLLTISFHSLIYSWPSFVRNVVIFIWIVNLKKKFVCLFVCLYSTHHKYVSRVEIFHSLTPEIELDFCNSFSLHCVNADTWPNVDHPRTASHFISIVS